MGTLVGNDAFRVLLVPLADHRFDLGLSLGAVLLRLPAEPAATQEALRFGSQSVAALAGGVAE